MPWIQYHNGNYRVFINTNNGTKIRYTKNSFFSPNRPESIDVKISNCCFYNCKYCHEGSSSYGEIAQLTNVINFADTLPPYTEIAVGGGDIMNTVYHTEMILKIFKEHKALCSITVHQNDFIKKYETIKRWIDEKLIYGVGVSLHNVDDPDLWKLLNKTPTAILHIIAGIATAHELEEIVNHHAKVLILGYKILRRGVSYKENFKEKILVNQQQLMDYRDKLFNNCKVCSFDNLALDQLKIKEYLKINGVNIWDKYYMGDDGTSTFFVDLVTMQYAKSSTSKTRYCFSEFDSVQSMYDTIRKEN